MIPVSLATQEYGLINTILQQHLWPEAVHQTIIICHVSKVSSFL